MSQKIFPTFSTVTWKPIIRIWYFLARIFLTTSVKWPFSFPSHPTFVSALPRENTDSEISLFYPMRYDCLINITRKTHFVHISDTWTDISSSCLFFNCLQQNCLKCWPTMRTQARRRFLHLLTAVSISSAPDQSRLYQSLLDFTNIPKLHLVDTLLHDS